MTPLPDHSPVLIIVFSVIVFLIVIAFIGYVLSAGSETQEFEPYAGEYDGDEGKIYEDAAMSQHEKDLEFFDYQTIGWMKRNSTPSYSNHPVWIKAFKIYNRSNKPLSRLCAPCYFKVLQYIIHLKNSENEKTNNEKSGNPGC